MEHMTTRRFATLLFTFALMACGAPGGGGSSKCPPGVPGGAGAACVSTSGCCYDAAAASSEEVLTCARFTRTCRPAAGLPLGETCLANVQCESRLCDPNLAACSAPCQRDTDCGSETVCARYLGEWACRPVCAADPDCAVYARRGGGARLTCKFTTTRGGLAAGACLP